MMLNLTGKASKKFFHFLWIFIFTFSVDVVAPTALLLTSSPVQAEGMDGYSKELQCTAPGFKRYKNDCTQFYRCVNFNKTVDRDTYKIFRFKCGPGTVFDETNSVCTWPHLAKPPCTNEYQPIPDSAPTTLATVPTLTPPTQDPLTQISTIFNNTIATKSTMKTTFEWNDSTTTQFPTIIDTSQVTINMPPIVWADSTGVCRAPGFWRNETDCAQFYRCVNFNTTDFKIYTIFRFTCGPGTVFDQKNSVCVWPHLANPPCANKENTTTMSSQISNETVTNFPQTTVTTPKPHLECTDSTGLCSSPGFKRNETDCTRFYRCVEFETEDIKMYTIFKFTCGPGTVFDQSNSVCTWPHLANPPCPNIDQTTISSETTHETVSNSNNITYPSTPISTTMEWSSTTTRNPTVNDDGTAWQTTTYQPSTELPDDTGLCRAPGFRRNQTDCTQFYRCVDFNMEDDKEIYTIFRFTCGPGTVFDERLSVCTWPHLANPPCINNNQTTVSTETILETDSYFTPSTLSTTPISTTTKSTITEGSTPTQISTISESTTLQVTTHKPDEAKLCSAPGFRRNQTDCTQFYRCVDFNMEDDKEIYTIFRFKCGPGNVFDETLSVCTWPHLAKPPCLNTDPTTTMSSQTIFDIAINDTYPVTIINTTTQATTYKPPTESTDTAGLCRAPGFWRNKTDCTKFYRCVDFNMEDDKEVYTIFRFTCGPGTVFDEILSVCTWPHLVKPPCPNELDQTATISSEITVETTTKFTPTPSSSTQVSTIPNNGTYELLSESTDTTGLCNAPGFKRNATDCTQFYRCVDFNMEDEEEIYTVFRFKCGPGTVFDEEWSVCTWPNLANPPCSSVKTNQEQLNHE